MLASLFWILNSLNKEYTTNVELKLKFKFDSSQYIPVTPLPNTIDMNVKGNGWDILRNNFGTYSDGVYITLKNPTQTRKIVGSTLPVLLADQLRNLEINYVITDTLHLKIDPWETRTVHLAIDPEKITYQEDYDRLGEILFEPDTIKIEGPKSTVDALSDPMVMEISGDELDDNFSETIEMPPNDQTFLRYTPDNIEISFEVVKWQEVTTTIQLDIENIPPKVELDVVKDSIHCTLHVAQPKMDDFQKIKNQLTAHINLLQLTEYNDKVVPQIIGLPEYARLIHIDSISVRSY